MRTLLFWVAYALCLPVYFFMKTISIVDSSFVILSPISDAFIIPCAVFGIFPAVRAAPHCTFCFRCFLIGISDPEYGHYIYFPNSFISSPHFILSPVTEHPLRSEL